MSTQRVAAQYVRMSTDHQPLSIDTQKVAIAKYAAEHGIDVVRTYLDEAKSGVTLAGRTGMKLLLRDVMESDCPFSCVLVLDVTRWGRFQDTDESAYYEYHCRKHGVRVEYVAEPFRAAPNSPFESILKQLKRAMAAEYSRELGVKCRAGQVHTVKLGYATGIPPCIGYRREAVSADQQRRTLLAPGDRKPALTDRVRWVLGPKWEVDEVGRIFRDFACGAPTTEIAKRLNREGRTTAKGRPFTASNIKVLLHSEVVTGMYTWGTRHKQRNALTNIQPLSEPVVNSSMVPAIVDRDTWLRVQQRYLTSANMRHSGYPKEILLAKLRDALARKPDLRVRDFPRARIPSPSAYRRQFGSVWNAYAAAGRPDELWNQARIDDNSAIRRLCKTFLKDVFALAQAAGVDAALDVSRHAVTINRAEMKVQLARHQLSFGTARWVADHSYHFRAAHRWLLVMRLNEDGRTGRDFYLLPPIVHATFTGMMNETSLPRLEEFRVPDAAALVRAFGGIRPEPK